MAKILHFEDFLSKRELDKITEFAAKELAAPVKLMGDWRKKKELKHNLKLKSHTEPPRAA
jgi:hypothetical protein